MLYQLGKLEPGKLAETRRNLLLKDPMVKREVDAKRGLDELIAKYDLTTRRGKRVLPR